MSPAQQSRHHSLDALRAGALLLGVFFHAAFSYLPGDQFWLFVDSERSPSVSILAFVMHMFRMTIFFLLAGYFGHMMLDRRGYAGFIKDRMKRVAAPMIAFWPLVFASVIALAIWAMVVANGGSMPDNPPPAPPLTAKTFPLTHLWFLYMLLGLYAGWLVVRSVLVRLGLAARLGTLSDALFASRFAPVSAILLALPTAWAMAHHAMWHPYFGIPTPDHGFVPNSVALVAYGSAFLVGVALARRSELIASVTRGWLLQLVMAAGLSVFCLWVIGTEVRYIQPYDPAMKTPFILAYSVAIWLWTFGLIGLCRRVWGNESTVRRYLADSAYWVYLVHLPIVMALQIWFADVALPASLKYAAVVAITTFVSLLSYQVLVRHSFIGRWLGGKRKAQTSRSAAQMEMKTA